MTAPSQTAERHRLGTSPLARRVRPLWSAAFRVLRDFVWADLQSGFVDIRGLSLVAQGLVLFGFGLLFVMVWAMLNNDVWRAQSPLLALANAVPRRGSLLPVALMPATLFVLSVAWSFALVGALHAHPPYRLAMLFIYLLLGLAWVDETGLADLTGFFLSWGLLLAVPLLYLLRWRARPRPALEFAIVFVLVSWEFVLTQSQGVEAWRVSGVPLVLGFLGTGILSFSILVTPVLYLAGTGMGEFALRVADWSVAIVDRFPRWAPRLVLGTLVVWRLRDVLADAMTRVGGDSLAGVAPAYLGGLLVPLCVGLAWWIVRTARGRGALELDSTDDVLGETGRAIMPLILIYSTPNLLAFLISDLLIMLAKLNFARAAMISSAERVVGVLNATDFLFGWHLLVAVGAVALATRLARRGRVELATFLAIFGLVDLYRELTNPGRPLSALADAEIGALIDFWWVLILAATALLWATRRRLTRERVGRLLLLILLTALVRQTDFISNRFSVFGFAGVGFLAFGLVWDALTVGAWANVESRALPRVSRIFLYLGYILLTVAVVNWALTTHDLASQARLTGDMALSGFNRFGRPVIYAIFAIALAAPATSRAGVAVPDASDPEPA